MFQLAESSVFGRDSKKANKFKVSEFCFFDERYIFRTSQKEKLPFPLAFTYSHFYFLFPSSRRSEKREREIPPNFALVDVLIEK